uniref:ELM2 domain-containing protein n=1 Tax=Leersia perrieri TaxID=77586 RepID=A0A0D9V7W1_9ORYZ
MVGMYQQQLVDDPFPLSGGHCSDQPRHAPASASTSSSAAVAASPLAQAQGQGHGASEPRRLFEALVGEILLPLPLRGAGVGNGGCGGGGPSGVGDLGELLRWTREVAADPVAARVELKARKRQVLALRRTRYLRMEDVTDADELPSFFKKRKYRSHNNHTERQNMPRRKSERLAKRMKLMTSVLLTQRKKIGVGEHFQAEIPDWTEPPSDELTRYKNDPNISKMLGTRIWPPEGKALQTDSTVACQGRIGQGRMESCKCPYPESFFCRQHHTDVARDLLRSELGQAFTEWRFDSMGEEVSKMWTREEQLKFNALERLVPVLDHKTFWAVAAKHLASKTRIDLVRYYLNVFLMRRVLSQCRLNLLEIDSDEDEAEEEEDEYQPESTGPRMPRMRRVFHESADSYLHILFYMCTCIVCGDTHELNRFVIAPCGPVVINMIFADIWIKRAVRFA